MKNYFLGALIGVSIILGLAAAVDPEISYFPSVSVQKTNFVSEQIVTNGITIGGVRNTSWPVSATPWASDVNGAGFSLTNALNISLSGTLSADVFDVGTMNVTNPVPVLKISQTNFVNEQIVTNGLTLGGVRNTSWPTATTYANVTNALGLTGGTSTFLRSDGTQQIPTTAGGTYNVLGGRLNGATTVNTVRYCGLIAPTAASVTEANVSQVMPVSCTLSNFYMRVATLGQGTNVVFTVMTNGVASPITISMTAASVAAFQGSDTTHSATVAAGDLISLRYSPNNTGTDSAPTYSFTIVAYF